MISEDNRIEEILIKEYGVLMTLRELSKVLDRSPAGVRMCINGNSELGIRLKNAKKKIGRRIHFLTTEVARIITDEYKV